MPLFPSFILALLRQLFAKRDCIARMYVRPTHTHTQKWGMEGNGLDPISPPNGQASRKSTNGFARIRARLQAGFFSATTTAQRYLPNGFGGDQKDFLPPPQFTYHHPSFPLSTLSYFHFENEIAAAAGRNSGFAKHLVFPAFTSRNAKRRGKLKYNAQHASQFRLPHPVWGKRFPPSLPLFPDL